MKYIVLILTILLLPLTAMAQHKHGAKGPNGGQMDDIAGAHAELIASGTIITFNVLDEDGKPIKTAGYSGSVLVISGPDRETIPLAPSGDSALKAEAKKPVGKGSSITLLLKTDEGKTGQARFTQ